MSVDDEMLQLVKKLDSLKAQYSQNLASVKEIDEHARRQMLVQKNKNSKFAVGMSETEPTGEEISMKDHDVVTVRNVGTFNGNTTKFGAADLGVKFFATGKKSKFANGYGEDEEIGESISLKDHDVVTVRKGINVNSTKFGAEDLGVKFLAKNKGKKFANGYGEDEEIGESISLKDHDVVTVRKDLNVNSTKFGAEDLGVKFLAKKNKRSGKWAEGYGDKEKMGE
jgi:hypothetical protein